MAQDLPSLFQELLRLENELRAAVDARLREDFDLTLGRLEAMQVMAREDSCRVYDIANELSITVGGTSKLVDRIEAAGLCVRRANPDDRRSSIINLTRKGLATLNAANAALDEELDRRLGSALPRPALEQFGATLAELRTAARASSSGDKAV